MTKRGSRLNIKVETPARMSLGKMCSHRNFKRDADKAIRKRPKPQQSKPEGFA